MTDPRVPPTRTVMTVPAVTGGGNPEQYLREAELRASQIDDTAEWTVQAQEVYERRTPSLVTSELLAGPGLTSNRFDRLRQLSASAMDYERPPASQSAVDRAIERVRRTGHAADGFSAYQLLLTVAPNILIEQYASEILHALRSAQDDTGDNPFPNASVTAVLVSPALRHRARLVSYLLRAKYDSRFAKGEKDHLQSAIKAGELVFQGAQGLLGGAVLADAYLGPLLGALSPAAWAFPVNRNFGVLIVSLGTPHSGVDYQPTELLQMLHAQGSIESVEYPTLSSIACSDAASWWVDKINRLLSVFFDPAVSGIGNDKNTFDPNKQLNGLLSVEQLFRRVHSIQTSQRDANARRVLLFTVLDTLMGLTGRDVDCLCDLRFAEATLSMIEESVPSAAGEVLLPGARRAVEALRQVQDGFFLARQLGESHVEIVRSDGSDHLSLSDAAAYYLKALRDGTHGHGDNVAKRRPRTETLMAVHNGNLPHDVPLLGYLYLLRLLLEQDDLKNRLHFVKA